MTGIEMGFRLADLGESHVTAAVIPVTCPRCGRPVRAIAQDDPRGYKRRERRLVFQCTADTGCAWEGVLVVELVDIPYKDRKTMRAS